MAALDLPVSLQRRVFHSIQADEIPQLNDHYLSHLHQVRNARKARESTSLLTPLLLESLDEMSSTSTMSPSTSANTALASDTPSLLGQPLDLRASDTAILSQYPSALIRLLVLLAPIIDYAVRFIRIATWTAGPGTASHSFLLLIAWWAVCLYGYEVLRYAPQAVLLSVLLFNGLVRAHEGISNKSLQKSRTVTSQNINVTIDHLAELADFASTLSSTLLEPIFALFTWKSFEETKALAIFLIMTWPIWLLCFGRQIWDVLGLPRVALGARKHAMQAFAVISEPLWKQNERVLVWGRQYWPSIFTPLDYLHRSFEQSVTLASPIARRLAIWLSTFTSSESLRLTVLPPFPLFSLSVRHLLLVVGTLALTWCSPWCALIRHALWRSALVRQSTRKTIAILCGKRPGSLYPILPSSSIADRSFTSTPFDKDPFTGQAIVDGPSSAGLEQASKDITRHEDVTYRFTIYENQRWWMGLDWTAALLPQERPSWADESNNPVSPPSSFSLPPAKTTLKPTPTSSNPEEYIKRLVRWQWIDAEWTVAGRDNVGDALGLQNKSRRDSSTSTTSRSGTLFSNSTINGAADAEAEDRQRRMSTSSGMSATNVNDLPSDLQLLDVDAEGWQYGDNSWDKMSRKGGLGRYTRRRRWIRRAVLVEIVQKHYTPTQEELKSDQESKEESKAGLKEGESGGATFTPASPTSPASPRFSGDLKQRLSRAAQGASSKLTEGVI